MCSGLFPGALSYMVGTDRNPTRIIPSFGAKPRHWQVGALSRRDKGALLDTRSNVKFQMVCETVAVAQRGSAEASAPRPALYPLRLSI